LVCIVPLLIAAQGAVMARVLIAITTGLGTGRHATAKLRTKDQLFHDVSRVAIEMADRRRARLFLHGTAIAPAAEQERPDEAQATK
jgi:hypothetical protein